VCADGSTIDTLAAENVHNVHYKTQPATGYSCDTFKAARVAMPTPRFDWVNSTQFVEAGALSFAFMLSRVLEATYNIQTLSARYSGTKRTTGVTCGCVDLQVAHSKVQHPCM
jgi:hypothetical protein